jgi:hypothetical protein
MKRNGLFKAAFAVAVPAIVVLATISAYPNTAVGDTIPHPQVTAELTEFKRTVLEVRREADTLQSFTRHRQMDWRSHINRLGTLKRHVNDLGKSLTELESMRPMASESQQLALEHARPHLVAAAQNLTQAIEMVNENRRNIHDAEYAEAVRSIHTHGNLLHKKLSAILDYDEAKMRFDNLELQSTTSAEGS